MVSFLSVLDLDFLDDFLELFAMVEFLATLFAHAHFYQSVFLGSILDIPKIHLINVIALLLALQGSTNLLPLTFNNLFFGPPSASNLARLVP